MKTPLAAVVFFMLATSIVHAKPTQVSGAFRARLVELYTSEGCSSCPPADQWLNSQTSNPDLWKKFVPVVFHVTYWDYIGWKDNLGQTSFDERQRDYSRRARKTSVYTPEFFISGIEAQPWGGDFDAFVSRQALPTGTLEVTPVSEHKYKISFTPGTDSDEKFTLHAAVLGSGITNQVKAGENSGSALRHDFVPGKIQTLELKKQGKSFVVTVDLTQAAAPPGSKSRSRAFWVTDSMEKPVVAAGGDL